MLGNLLIRKKEITPVIEKRSEVYWTNFGVAKQPYIQMSSTNNAVIEWLRRLRLVF